MLHFQSLLIMESTPIANSYPSVSSKGRIILLDPQFKAYVVGFAFDEPLERVILIQKLRPDWQKYLLNGPGGRIEVGETPTQAMQREFREETGINTPDWLRFLTLDVVTKDFLTARVFFFRNVLPETVNPKTLTDEHVAWYRVDEILSSGGILLPNLHWLLPMARLGNVYLGGIEEKG